MQSINNYTSGNLIMRLSLIFFVALAGVCNALAESKFHMDGFTINPGEEKVVAINFDNTDNISSLQIDFTLPDGLSLESFKSNEERLERGVHSLDVTPQTASKYRLTVFATYNDPIPGEGALAYLTFKADDSFIKPGKIKFDNAHLSDPNGEKIDPADFTVDVSPEIGTVEVSEPAFSIKPGGMHSIELVMNNTVDVYGMEGRITLPEGLSLELNDKGRPVVKYGDRLPQDAVFQINAETGKFILTSMSRGKFGNEGPLFSVNVVASEDIAETLDDIVIKDIKVSCGSEDDVFSFDEAINVKVTNSYVVEYLPSMEAANELQAKLDAAIETIAEVAPDVKESEGITAAEAGIQQQIDDLKKAIEDAYNDGTLGANKETILEVVPGIETAIEQLIEDAKTAQASYNDYIQANEAADGLQAKLDAAIETIAEVAPDVKDSEDITNAEAGIQQQINDLKKAIEDAYAGGTISADKETILEVVSGIEAAIDQLIEDAKKAQEASGISNVEITGEGVEGIYTISGSKAGNVVRGTVNIIRYSDGSVKKLFVK